MNGLAFPASCPIDGGALVMVTASEGSKYRTTAICQCEVCSARVQVIVALDVIRDPRFKRGFGPY